MSQVLNLEIKSGDSLISNAYYRWSGFTNDSLELIEKAVHQLELLKEQNSYASSPDVLLRRAINALHNTGAKINQQDINYIQSSPSLAESTRLELLHQIASYPKVGDQSAGLIAISTDQMAFIEQAAVFTATIHYDDLTVDFGVLDYYENIEELQSSYDMDEEDADSIPLYEKDIKTLGMTRQHIEDLKEALELASNHEFDCFKTPDGSYYSAVGS